MSATVAALIAANSLAMFLIEVGWIRLAVWRRWGFVAKPAILTTIVHSGLLLAMVLWTAHFVRSVLPPTLLTNPNCPQDFRGRNRGMAGPYTNRCDLVQPARTAISGALTTSFPARNRQQHNGFHFASWRSALRYLRIPFFASLICRPNSASHGTIS